VLLPDRFTKEPLIKLCKLEQMPVNPLQYLRSEDKIYLESIYISKFEERDPCGWTAWVGGKAVEIDSKTVSPWTSTANPMGKLGRKRDRRNTLHP
jgi:hypothetical protein